jgi:hypothetical protein
MPRHGSTGGHWSTLSNTTFLPVPEVIPHLDRVRPRLYPGPRVPWTHGVLEAMWAGTWHGRLSNPLVHVRTRLDRTLKMAGLVP